MPTPRPTPTFPAVPAVLAVLTALLTLPAARPAAAQAPSVFEARSLPVETRQFGDLAEGPYNRLVIRNVMVLPGHGGPPVGPYDILIEGNVISEMRSFDPVAAERAAQAGRPLERMTGDRVIEGDGMYVMPGMFDLHYHVRTEPIPLEYSYYLKLAHGVTTTVTGGSSPDTSRTRSIVVIERMMRLDARLEPET